MPVIDGLDYADGMNPLDASEKDTIQERLKAMNRQILTDSDSYVQCKEYVEGHQGAPYAPSDQRAEIKALRKRAVMNLMPLAVSIPSQLSFADGYRRNGENFPVEWDCWQKSGFNSRQTSVWSAALTYGVAYVALEDLGQGDPRLRLLSTRNTVAFYDDPINDDHPVFAMTIRSRPHKDVPGQVVYYDAERISYYHFTDGGDYILDWEYFHTLGETPIRRFTCILDDEGTSRGVVEMLIPAQDRVNQASFDLLATSTFSAFKVRWASGMMGDPILDPATGDPKVDNDGNQMYKPIPVDQSTWVQSEDPSAKFGAIDETPLDGFQNSLEQGVRHFAVQGQLPPHALLGNMSNLSAETLVAAMSQTQRFAHILKTSWAQSIVALMRLVARDIGVEEGKNEDPQSGRIQDHYEGEVRWRDMADHTLAAQVDALGKGVQMLNIPARALWSRFPGVTTGDIESWEEMAEEQNEIDFNDEQSAQASAERERSYQPPTNGGIDLGGVVY